jgi:hypothetical protein
MADQKITQLTNLLGSALDDGDEFVVVDSSASETKAITALELKEALGLGEPVTVSSLPSASTAGAGARGFVTDATSTTFASTVTGGGSNNVPVYSDGTNWKIG